MNIELLAAGTKAPAWVNDGFREYQKRLPRDWNLELREVPVSRRSRNSTREKLVNDEGERMMALLKPGALVIALDRSGAQMSTPELAASMEEWRQEFSRVQILIGGPDGLSKGCLDSAAKSWSLSLLTFPHFMVRVMVAEQLYRAWSILNNHPYHK